MRYVALFFLNAVFLSALISCSKNSDADSGKDIDTIGVSKTDIFDSVRVRVQQKIKSIFLDSLKNNFLSEKDSLHNLYAYNQYQPFWLYQERIEKVLAILNDARTDGLNPEDYAYSKLKDQYAAVIKDGFDYDEALGLEVAISRSVVLYVSHLYKGKVDPRTVFPNWNYKEPASEIVSDSMLVRYFTGNLDSLPIILRPKYDIYHALRKTLELVDSIGAKAIHMDTISYVGRTLTLGDTSYVIFSIKKRLQSTSEYNFDSLNNVFDEQLQESIKLFQKHVGISASGKIDKKTIDKLNFTVAEIRAALLVNMERFRWLPNDLPEQFILVNIADYTLRHFIGREVVYTESVIVGREYTSTPVFEAMMSYIEFNPYWTVPRSIAVHEMLASLKRNPNYLQSHNMDLFIGNTQVAIPNSFSSYTADNFPFTIRENPGPKNSLGQVKFMFPNPYSIYLHDTPGKYLFERDERSFSHGCIRLKDPLKFSLHLLSKQGVTQAQMDKIIRAKKNYAITLKEKIPVMLIYMTCYSKKADSHLYFFKDIYGKDKKIMEGLKQKVVL